MRANSSSDLTDLYGKTALDLHAALDRMTRHITFARGEDPDEGIYPDAQCPLQTACVSSSGNFEPPHG